MTTEFDWLIGQIGSENVNNLEDVARFVYAYRIGRRSDCEVIVPVRVTLQEHDPKNFIALTSIRDMTERETRDAVGPWLETSLRAELRCTRHPGLGLTPNLNDYDTNALEELNAEVERLLDLQIKTKIETSKTSVVSDHPSILTPENKKLPGNFQTARFVKPIPVAEPEPFPEPKAVTDEAPIADDEPIVEWVALSFEEITNGGIMLVEDELVIRRGLAWASVSDHADALVAAIIDPNRRTELIALVAMAANKRQLGLQLDEADIEAESRFVALQAREDEIRRFERQMREAVRLASVDMLRDFDAEGAGWPT